MPFASICSAEVEYAVAGEGPGLMLVHGTGGSADSLFGEFVPYFSGDRTVIRPNFSGSGRTTDGGDRLTTQMVVEQLATVAREAADGPVDLLGFSLGAAMATAFAATHPELVRRLVLVGGWVHSTGARDQFYFSTLAKLFSGDRDLFKRFAQLTAYSPAAVESAGPQGLADYLRQDQWPPLGMGRQIDLCARVDNRSLLADVAAPTLVIGMVEDQMVPVDGSRQLHAGIAGSQLIELPGQGHMDWVAAPTPVMELTRAFINAK
ncbi:alpha/beta fold hydrolase [Streptomyces kronopolitis]|uniref:alpha/beta fold hydrolase n=1 Tax=Streptomyces kronopolitis TaxID=1612435 RepID=UPI0020C0020C|nr:alpha/beta hydrolase [Streptomyces kronopolitis]MCL6298892.1 alpha/beta hydrolase [Streptomyces kronopolitis]